jgi:hypothetical protein
MLRWKTNPSVDVAICGLQVRSSIQETRLQSVCRVPAQKLNTSVEGWCLDRWVVSEVVQPAGESFPPKL